MQVIANMNRGDDVEYRRALYEEKKQLFFKLFSQIKLIENAVSDFQSNFLVRSQEFVRDELTKKRLLTTKEMDISVRDLGQYLTLSMQIVS